MEKAAALARHWAVKKAVWASCSVAKVAVDLVQEVRAQAKPSSLASSSGTVAPDLAQLKEVINQTSQGVAAPASGEAP